MKQLNNRAFAGCDFKSITIGEGVTSIGDKVFEGCINLSSINIPSSVTAIGEDAFKNCNGLRRVHISDLAAWCNIAFSGVYSNPLRYAHRLFLNGTEVKDLVIPSGTTNIRDWAFFECVELASVTLQDGVTSIGASAFRNCRRITSITIPTSVTTIGDFAFCECNEATSITIPEGVTSIGMYAFASCWLVTSISIPNSVTTIGSTAFQDCSRLNTLTIGSGVKHIDFRAFSDCSRLTDVYCLAETAPEKSNAYQIFYGSTINKATLHVPDASVEAYRAEKPWSDFKDIVGLSDVTGIALAAADDSSLQVESHNGVLTIRGVGEGIPISVYDLAGRCVAHTTACKAATTVSTPFKVGATAIVRIGSVAEQVVMR